MNWTALKDLTRRFSVVLFAQDDVIKTKGGEIERVGRQRNVHLVIQPCPYEGVEFLSRVAHDLIGDEVGVEKDIFWHVLSLNETVSKEALTEVSRCHHEYLCAILQQDASKVAKLGRELQAHLRSYS